MAENDQAQEKTEDPTQRRLEKAREDGEVLSSKEMFVFASSTAGLFVLAVLGLFSANIFSHITSNRSASFLSSIFKFFCSYGSSVKS